MVGAAELRVSFLKILSFKQSIQFHSIYCLEQGVLLDRKPLKEF